MTKEELDFRSRTADVLVSCSGQLFAILKEVENAQNNSTNRGLRKRLNKRAKQISLRISEIHKEIDSLTFESRIHSVG